MLTYEMQGDILHVTETVMSFFRDYVQHWYYDTKRWLVSDNGLLDEKPNRPMTEDSIAWVKKYYLPKVGVQA